MKLSYIYPAIAEPEQTTNILARFQNVFLNWNKVVCAVEQAICLLKKENQVAECDEVREPNLTDAIRMRDSYLFMIGKEISPRLTSKNKKDFAWLTYRRSGSIFSLSDRRKLLKKALAKEP